MTPDRAQHSFHLDVSSPNSHNCSICPTRMEGVFCELSSDLVQGLNNAKTTNKYKRGQVLFYQGNSPVGLFCVYSGKVKVSKTGADGKEVILRLAQGGDLLGYRSVLAEENYQATAEVIEDAEICFLDKRFFVQMIEKDAGLALNVIHKLGRELGTAEDRLSELVTKDVRQRLCHTLLALLKTHGENGKDGVKIEIRLSRAEIASIVGATTETVIRTLSDLQEDGLVDLVGKQIIIKNANALIEEAGIDY